MQERNGMGNKDLITDGMMDSGLGRTLSSYGRSKMRSRSEERTSTTPIMPMLSVRSEALSEPITKIQSNHKARYKNYNTKEDSVLISVPISRSRLFSQNENYNNYNNECDNLERQKLMERHNKLKKEKSTENHNVKETEESAKLQVSPLNTNRLQPTRHRTNNAILTILDNGEVCTELVRHKNGKVYIKKQYKKS